MNLLHITTKELKENSALTRNTLKGKPTNKLQGQ